MSKPSAIDRRIDRALDTIAELISRTPKAERGGVLMEVTAGLINAVMHQSTHPTVAATMMHRWIDAGLTERRQQAAIGTPPAAPSTSPADRRH